MSYKTLKLLFFGLTEDPGGSNYQRLNCLRQLGVNVQAHNTGIFIRRTGLYQRIKGKVIHAFSDAGENRKYNDHVLKACSGSAPDCVWFEWPLKMDSQTLKLIRERWPQSLIISFQDDNPFGNRTNDQPRWQKFIDNIPLYDVHFVKRPSDVIEFTRRGAKHVVLFQHGVYEPLFHPDDRPLDSRGPVIPVSFVGTALDHRRDYITQMFERYKISIKVFGSDWKRTWVGWRYARYFSPETYAEDYARVIWDSRISLGFVSSTNRDEYTMRTFEIPGCGGFFLAERTLKHQEFYEEGKEAEFFSSAEEAADKVRFFLNNEEARRRIAIAGYERCMRSDYRLISRMREALAQLFP